MTATLVFTKGKGRTQVSWRKSIEALLKQYNRKLIQVSGVGLDHKTAYVITAGQLQVRTYTDKDYKALYVRFFEMLTGEPFNS